MTSYYCVFKNSSLLLWSTHFQTQFCRDNKVNVTCSNSH